MKGDFRRGNVSPGGAALALKLPSLIAEIDAALPELAGERRRVLPPPATNAQRTRQVHDPLRLGPTLGFMATARPRGSAKDTLHPSRRANAGLNRQ